MKAVRLAAALMFLTTPALSQGINMMNERAGTRSADDIAKDKAVEEQYRAKMNQIPDKKAASDPWGNVRATPEQKKPAAKKTN